MQKIQLIIVSLLVANPVLMFAAGEANGKTFSSFVYGLGNIFQTIMSLILGLSIIVFLWGLAVRLLQIGNSEKQAQARYIMLYGIIGLVVSFTIVGILNVGLNTFLIPA